MYFSNNKKYFHIFYVIYDCYVLEIGALPLVSTQLQWCHVTMNIQKQIRLWKLLKWHNIGVLRSFLIIFSKIIWSYIINRHPHYIPFENNIFEVLDFTNFIWLQFFLLANFLQKPLMIKNIFLQRKIITSDGWFSWTIAYQYYWTKNIIEIRFVNCKFAIKR